MYEDEELEKIKERELMELQRKLYEEERKREEKEKIELQRRMILTRILTSEARGRLTNIRMVKPDLARAIEDQLITLYASGQITTKIDDEKLKLILKKILNQKKEIRIRFK